jgi:ferredoxin-NADP reductase
MRGIRRYFTIASAPEETDVRLGVKIPAEKASSFKVALAAMTPGTTMTARGLSGDFVLPTDTKEPIVMIAGGIGITPFRSMIEHIIRSGEKRPAYLFNANKTYADVAYLDLVTRARDAFGLSTIHVLEDTTGAPADMVIEKGFIDGAMLARHITNVPSCRYYISGPSGMVNA